MLNLSLGIDINNLIDDLRFFSWEAADILLHYSNQLKDKNMNKNIIQIKDNNEPVTLADLKVNEYIISRIKQKYQTTNWHLLSEENGIMKFNCDNNDVECDRKC